MNQKIFFLIVLCFAIILTAFGTKNGQVAIFSLPVLAYLTIGVTQIPTQSNVQASRSLQLDSQKNVLESVHLENKGNQLLMLQVEAAQFTGLKILEGTKNYNLLLHSAESADVQTKYQGKRGVYQCQTLQIFLQDPLGLTEQGIELPAPAFVKIKPATVRLRHLPVYPRKTLHLTGNIPARLAGSGTDMWGVREYLPGDQLHRLNWRKIARNPQRMFTNEFEQEEITDIGIILDARMMGNSAAVEEELLEYAVSAGASLAEHFLREGNRVGLLVFGKKIIHLFPGYGKVQLNKILWNLTIAELRSFISFNQLSYLPFRLFSARAQIFIISLYNAEDLQGYARLRAYGYPLILLSPDPVTYMAEKAPFDAEHITALHAARMERTFQLQQLTRLGVQVINWPVQQPLNVVLQTALGQAKKMRGIKGRLE
jgi:uncharacterized protein (DUF58 family)